LGRKKFKIFAILLFIKAQKYKDFLENVYTNTNDNVIIISMNFKTDLEANQFWHKTLK